MLQGALAAVLMVQYGFAVVLMVQLSFRISLHLVCETAIVIEYGSRRIYRLFPLAHAEFKSRFHIKAKRHTAGCPMLCKFVVFRVSVTCWFNRRRICLHRTAGYIILSGMQAESLYLACKQRDRQTDRDTE